VKFLGEEETLGKMVVVDPSSCTGCQLCVAACSLKHESQVNPLYSRIRAIRFEGKGAYIPVTCQQCKDAPCQSVCPVKAIERHEETGALIVNQEKCIGCKACIIVCPFGAISWTADGRIVKCDLCDGDPLCVKLCTREALAYVPATTAHLKTQVKAAEKFSEILKKISGV
jgi:Fe-S-cluster-containing hydrogenase component 2